MTEQPTAMRPIDAAYQQGYASGVAGQQHYIHAIETELRRMHSVNAQLLEALEGLKMRFPTSEELHAAGWDQADIDEAYAAYDEARSAIAAAKEMK